MFWKTLIFHAKVKSESNGALGFLTKGINP